MRSKLIDLVEKNQLRQDYPDFKVGDNVKVHVRIREGEKERIQIFEGLVISKKESGTRETFTVRKMSFGVGVNRTFPTHSPAIAQIEIVRTNKVRRSKLYYMKDRSGKSARLKERKRKPLSEKTKADKPAEKVEQLKTTVKSAAKEKAKKTSKPKTTKKSETK